MTDQRSATTAPTGNSLTARSTPTTPQAPAGEPIVSVSRGLAAWLTANETSFAFSSYQTGRLFLVGVLPNGTVSVHQEPFTRVMGLWWDSNRLYLASRLQLWRLENILAPGELAYEQFDAVLVARSGQITGNIDTHEVAIDREGRPVFVNSGYSCLATLDPVHSFRPIWKPSFISELVPEDRCHLNGLAMMNGKPKYVTAVAKSDKADGWHGKPLPKGVLIDVETDEIVTNELSMPHSPRVVDGKIYALDSGRGFLVQIDRETGKVTDLAFCPGWLRGLAIKGNHALVTVSKPRYGSFEGLPIDAEMKERDASPECGVLIIDLATGETIEWLKIEGSVEELFAVELMPGVKCPMTIGPSNAEIVNKITFDPEIRSLPY
jgi:uncharacterized protein (TIGR03032 family)